jgi:hypothetical protein
MKLDPIPGGSNPSLNVSLPELPPSAETELSPLQQQLLDARDRVYGQPRAAAPQQPSKATAVDAENSKTGNLR